MRTVTRAAVVAILTAMALPALADTKAGVDAWGRGDYARAVQEWRAPAVAGDADAQFNLGQAYKLGRGVTADFVQAEDWYGRAAKQGHIQGADNYGLALFQNGKRQEARPWLEKSAARGEPRAQYVLGTMLFNGDGVEKDWVRAYALMTRAAAAGLPQANNTLRQMDGYIPLEQRQRAAVLARDLERGASSAQVAASLPPSGTTPRPGLTNEDIPPSLAAAPPPARPVPAARPAPAQPRPAPAAAAGGRYRVQFGAFGVEANARALFDRLKRQVAAVAPLTPYLVKTGALTRLQAGPLATSADANRVCAAVKPTGTPCVVVGP